MGDSSTTKATEASTPATTNAAVVQKCAVCNKPSTAHCGNCSKVYYCSKECIKKDWKAGHKSYCIPVEIKTDSADGRSRLYATRDVTAGDTVWKEKPLVIGPINTKKYSKHKDKKTVLCMVCCTALTLKEVRKCMKCNLPLCGDTACAEDKIHAENECQLLSESAGRDRIYMGIAPTDYCFFLRIMRLKAHYPAKWEKFMGLNGNPDFPSLEQIPPFHQEVNAKLLEQLKKSLSHLDSRVQKHLIQVCGTTDLFMRDTGASDSSVSEIQKVLDIMDWSSVDDDTMYVEDTWSSYSLKFKHHFYGDQGPSSKVVTPPYVDRHKKWICHFGSTAAHSCAPNVTWKMTRNNQVVFRAIRKLSAGEEILISKDPEKLHKETKKRRARLFETHGFLCSCKRCADPTELKSYYSARRCLKPACQNKKSFVLMINPLLSHNNGTDWQCNTCGDIVSADSIQDITDAKLEAELEQIISRSKMNKKLNKFVDDMQKLGQKYMKILCPFHAVLHSINQNFILYTLETIIHKLKQDVQLPHNPKFYNYWTTGEGVSLAMAIVKKSKIELLGNNFVTQGWTKYRGHTYTWYHFALTYILRYGFVDNVAQVGMGKADLKDLETEATKILEFWCPENPSDADCISTMQAFRKNLDEKTGILESANPMSMKDVLLNLPSTTGK